MPCSVILSSDVLSRYYKYQKKGNPGSLQAFGKSLHLCIRKSFLTKDTQLLFPSEAYIHLAVHFLKMDSECHIPINTTHIHFKPHQSPQIHSI